MDEDMGEPMLDEGIFVGALTRDSLVCSIIMGVLAVAGLIGNSLMLRSWIKYPNLRNDFYTVFAVLSASDIVFLSVGVPIAISDMMEIKEINVEGWCKYSRYFMYVSGFIAGNLIVTLAALRAILLLNRNRIPRPRAKHLLIVSGLSSLIIFLISIPIIKMFTSLKGYCYFHPDEDHVRHTWLLNSFSSFVPLCFVFVTYVVTYIVGKRYFADSYSPRERQKSRLVNAVVVAFIIFQLPYRIVSIYGVEYIQPLDEEMFFKITTAKDYLMCVLMFGKVVRPILCSKLTTDLGHAFDEIINCQGCQKSYQRANNSTGIETHVQPQSLAAEAPLSEGAVGGEPELDPEPPSPLNSIGRSRIGVDRSISTSSSASTNSQAPLIRNSPSSPSAIEMM